MDEKASCMKLSLFNCEVDLLRISNVSTSMYCYVTIGVPGLSLWVFELISWELQVSIHHLKLDQDICTNGFVMWFAKCRGQGKQNITDCMSWDVTCF